MIIKEKEALKAVFRLLHKGRSMAFEGMPSQELAWYFDELDYLMGLIISWQDDMSQQFTNALQEVCEKYGCSEIAVAYHRS